MNAPKVAKFVACNLKTRVGFRRLTLRSATGRLAARTGPPGIATEIRRQVF
jgi:hypothetical protein